MSVQLATALRNARADAITTFAGANALIRLYTASYATLLVELACDDPLAPGASGGVLTFNTVSSGTCVASGDAAVAKLFKSDGTTLIMQGLTVTDSGGSGQVKLDQTGTALSTGQTVTLTSATVTEGNS